MKPGTKPKSIIERFESKVELIPFSTCHWWVGAANHVGYGKLFVNGKFHGAHRVSYRLYVGDIPEGMLVCHKCDNPSCVNPDHLFLGTFKSNAADMVQKGRDKPERGENNCWSKLSEAKVLAIRELQGKLSSRKIGKLYGVCKTTVLRIHNREKWKHVA